MRRPFLKMALRAVLLPAVALAAAILGAAWGASKLRPPYDVVLALLILGCIAAVCFVAAKFFRN